MTTILHRHTAHSFVTFLLNGILEKIPRFPMYYRGSIRGRLATLAEVRGQRPEVRGSFFIHRERLAIP